ncbi:cytochrome-c peroxidase [Pedobacter mucosus]|uniref:cytochrome-c peroxidase n=1 Tax=Pedobacter mucosus TaxID=2895286 RepID=UPI001EE3FA34|nr:cytochrome c peroxidase [Pedobacter mucosus]UKT64256.1 cytochrome-c peroxidase [Pedobacter mucosus]
MKSKIKKINKRNYQIIAGIPLLFFLLFALSSLKSEEDEIQKGIFIFAYPTSFGNRINVPEDNLTTNQGVYLGRRLFYEVRLSANNSLSCGSCHMQAKAFTDGRKLSIGVDKNSTERNTMALVNLLWNRKFFWDARSNSLEAQASFPMTNPHEMGQSLAISVKKLQSTNYYPKLFKAVFGDEQVTGDRIVKALAQFERTLISADSRYDRYLNQSIKLSDAEMKGILLFNTAPNSDKQIRGANCAHCHGGPKNYMELFHNNGLDSTFKDAGIGAITGLQSDQGRFKIPTLRNIALSAPYMHDGRFATLEEVVEHYSEHIQNSNSLSAFLQNESNVKGSLSVKLKPDEKKDLIAFLNTLTDYTFVANPNFSNPFLKP